MNAPQKSTVISRKTPGVLKVNDDNIHGSGPICHGFATMIKIVAFRLSNTRGKIVVTRGGKIWAPHFSKEKSYYLPRVPPNNQSVRSGNGKWIFGTMITHTQNVEKLSRNNFTFLKVKIIPQIRYAKYHKICDKKTSVADPWHFGVDPDPGIHCIWLMDPDPAIFVIDLQNASKKLIF